VFSASFSASSRRWWWPCRGRLACRSSRGTGRFCSAHRWRPVPVFLPVAWHVMAWCVTVNSRCSRCALFGCRPSPVGLAFDAYFRSCERERAVPCSTPPCSTLRMAVAILAGTPSSDGG
jgi:hypothetical protein